MGFSYSSGLVMQPNGAVSRGRIATNLRANHVAGVDDFDAAVVLTIFWRVIAGRRHVQSKHSCSHGSRIETLPDRIISLIPHQLPYFRLVRQQTLDLGRVLGALGSTVFQRPRFNLAHQATTEKSG
jgi:hypothetical protein